MLNGRVTQLGYLKNCFLMVFGLAKKSGSLLFKKKQAASRGFESSHARFIFKKKALYGSKPLRKPLEVSEPLGSDVGILSRPLYVQKRDLFVPLNVVKWYNSA